MKDNINDFKECIEQAINHSSKISSLFDGSIDQHFFSEDHMANVMRAMWFENQNIRNQLEIIKKIV